ncbi:hypothetical protein CW712_06225 [Candidatus Bathyarchaeota archaeon]|nr:MAG: hypothetical protein CW712_06225 [Candidatus Bathyarchaeota archaeon]
MASGNYLVLKVNGQEAYVRKDRLDELRKVDGVVFDCDGVLVDVRGSYNRAISKTSAYILEGLTGIPVDENFVSDEVIFLFRRTGGFNCDRDTVYGIVMFMLMKLPEEIRMKLRKLVQTVEWQPDAFERFSRLKKLVKETLKPVELNEKFFEGFVDELKKFTERLDASGVDSVDRDLAPHRSVSQDDFYTSIKRFLLYPGDVGESVVSTVFEEFFCGPALFKKTYGIEPKFNSAPGMVENETVIIQAETLDRLAAVLGKRNIGIASGSRFEPRRQVLNGLLSKFNREALVFVEVVEKAERELSNSDCAEVNLKKPHPFSLIKSAEGFGGFVYALYVGDSMEDALMVEEARKRDPRYLFAGVYRFSGVDDVVRRIFLNSDCDMVIPSVNELPFVLEKVRRLKN